MSTQHNHEPTSAEASTRALAGACILLAIELTVAGVLTLLWREERLAPDKVNSLRLLVEAAPRGEPAIWPPRDEQYKPGEPRKFNNENVDFVEDVRVFDLRQWVVGEAGESKKRLVREFRKVLVRKLGHVETLTFEAKSGKPLSGEFVDKMSDKKASPGGVRMYKTGKGQGLDYVAQVDVDISSVAREGDAEITVSFNYSGDFDGPKGSWAGALIKDKSLRECMLFIISPPARPFTGIKGGQFQSPDPFDTAKTYGRPVQDPFGGWAALDVPSPKLDHVYLLQWDPWK